MKLESIDSVYPSSYNPRAADPARLQMVALSLRKLGFLLPVYAAANSEILSGHQRQLVARGLGYTLLPVSRTPPMDETERKHINIVFNRATNDLAVDDTPDRLTRELQLAQVESLAAALPDKIPDSPESFPCLQTSPVSISDLVAINTGRWINYAVSISKTLARKKVIMPVVITPDLRIVNGVGRVQMLAEMKRATCDAVIISEAEGEFARAMLNLLSMDFDIHTRYGDLLRYNSFRRQVGIRTVPGYGMLFALSKSSVAREVDISEPEMRRRWTAQYGTRVLDFGAGRRDEVNLLRDNGIDADAFEPYCLGNGNDIDLTLSRQVVREFLRQIAAGKQWQSVFFSAILNSVPFQQDREHVVQVLAACCGKLTTMYGYSWHAAKGSNRDIRGGGGLAKTAATNIQFVLDYEPNTLLGDFSSRPKVQKYFTLEEWTALFKPHFESVQVELGDSSRLLVTCRRPRPADPARLRAALEFEFDLPYPDGRMGMVDEALQAFSARLGVNL